MCLLLSAFLIIPVHRISYCGFSLYFPDCLRGGTSFHVYQLFMLSLLWKPCLFPSAIFSIGYLSFSHSFVRRLFNTMDTAQLFSSHVLWWVELCPTKMRMFMSQHPASQKGLIWKQGLCRCTSWGGLTGGGEPLIQYEAHPYKRGNFDTTTRTHREYHVKTGFMLPQAKELPEAKAEVWNRTFQEPAEWAGPYQHLDLGLPASRTARQ